MKRLLLLAALSAIAVLMLAPAALAQGVIPSGGTGSYGCPENAPFVATPPGEPGEGGLRCFPTQEEANIYSTTGGGAAEEPPAVEEPPVTGTQYGTTEPTTPMPTTVAPLPETGGPALLLTAAGLLLATGLVGLRMSRRP